MSTLKAIAIFIRYSGMSLEIQTVTFHPYFRWSRTEYTFIVICETYMQTSASLTERYTLQLQAKS